jgi:hypothetical protein
MTVGNAQRIQQQPQPQDGGWSSHSDYSSGADEEGNMEFMEEVGAVLVTGPAGAAGYGGGAFAPSDDGGADEAAAAASGEFSNVQNNDDVEEQDEDEAEQQLAAQVLAAREQGGSGGDGGGGRGGGGVGSQERAWLEFELQRIQKAAAASAALRAGVEKEKMDMLT